MARKIRLDKEHHAAWAAFISAHSMLLERINGRLAKADLLPLEWYDVLLVLDKAPEQRLRMSELADKVLLSRSGSTRLADKLEAAGLLRREVCPSDRRGAFAVLTDEGKAALARTWPEYAQGIAEHFAQHLSKTEAQTLTKWLKRILTSVEGRS